MRDVYQNALRVVAWPGRLCDDGELAIDAAHGIYEEFLRRNEALEVPLVPHREIRELEGETALLKGLADDFQKQFGLIDDTGDEQNLAAAKAFGSLFDSEFWTRVWIWQELIVARGIQLLWDIESMDLEPFYVAGVVIAWIDYTSTYLLFPDGYPSATLTMALTIRRRRLWEMDHALNFRSLLQETHEAR
jgi:hypothetical protein